MASRLCSFGETKKKEMEGIVVGEKQFSLFAINLAENLVSLAYKRKRHSVYARSGLCAKICIRWSKLMQKKL